MLDTSIDSVEPSPDGPADEDSRLVGPGIHIPALDGLRGFAVVAVVIYHLWPDTMTGGWLGVSLFFSLSGFLVVGLLDDELSDGSVDLLRFYRRRVRRLLPAGLITIGVVVAAVLVVEHDSARRVALDGFWAVLNSANWREMASSDGYGAIFDQSVKPLAHMWSLAIEEQFYLTIPLLIAWTRRPVAVVAGGALIAALGQIVWWDSADSYFASPVRAAEIVAGAALALAVRRRPGVVKAARLWPIAAAVSVYAVFTVGESSSIVFRGLPAAISVAWVVLIVACLRDDRYSRLMSNGLWRWLGLRSYAIYLFHWPLIVLTDLHPVVILALTLGLAEISYRLVEDPIRRQRRISRPLASLGAAALVLALVAGGLGLVLDRPLGLADSAQAASLPAWIATSDSDAAAPSTTSATSATGPVSASAVVVTTVPESTIPEVPTVAVIGDSTATQIAAGLRTYGDTSQTMAVIDGSVEGCSALIDPLTEWRTYKVTYGYLGEFSFESPCRIGVHQLVAVPDLVLMIDHGSVLADHQRPDGTWASVLDPDLMESLRQVYDARIDEARSLGAVLVLTTAPQILDPERHGLFGSMADPVRLAVYNSFVTELAAAESDVALFDLGRVLDESGSDGTYPRSDGLHVDLDASEPLAIEVIAPLVEGWLLQPDEP